MTSLSAPVGSNGKLKPAEEINRPADVLLVQRWLNAWLKGQRRAKLLPESGACDKATIAAIHAFQARALLLNKGARPHPGRDGRVDPGDETHVALKQAAEGMTLRGCREVPVRSPTSGLAFAPRNNQTGRRDATGAFQLGATIFTALYRLPKPVLIDNTEDLSRDERQEDYAKRRKAVYEAIEGISGPVDVVAFFGHGEPGSLSTFGFFSSHLEELATKLGAACKENAVVILYACGAGAFGGFAEKLASKINSGGSTAKTCRIVYGHLVKGHSFTNPYYTYFPQRDFVVTPGSAMFRRWDQLIKTTKLWARFPFLSDVELYWELMGPGDFPLPQPSGLARA